MVNFSYLVIYLSFAKSCIYERIRALKVKLLMRVHTVYTAYVFYRRSFKTGGKKIKSRKKLQKTNATLLSAY